MAEHEPASEENELSPTTPAADVVEAVARDVEDAVGNTLCIWSVGKRFCRAEVGGQCLCEVAGRAAIAAYERAKR